MAGSGEGQRRSVREAVEKTPASLQFGKLPDPWCPRIVRGLVTSHGSWPDAILGGAQGDLGSP